jgi:hypothetical protein
MDGETGCRLSFEGILAPLLKPALLLRLRQVTEARKCKPGLLQGALSRAVIDWDGPWPYVPVTIVSL